MISFIPEVHRTIICGGGGGEVTKTGQRPDGWLPVFLKMVSNLIAAPLSLLFQKSLNESMVTSQWREVCITAIHKNGPKNLFENYRPVSITSIICKLMESIV